MTCAGRRLNLKTLGSERVNEFLIVTYSKLDKQSYCSGIGVVLHFDLVLKYCDTWQFFCDIAVFCSVFSSGISGLPYVSLITTQVKFHAREWEGGTG